MTKKIIKQHFILENTCSDMNSGTVYIREGGHVSAWERYEIFSCHKEGPWQSPIYTLLQRKKNLNYKSNRARDSPGNLMGRL